MIKNEYKCNHCGSEYTIGFRGFASLYFVRCPKCLMNNSKLIKNDTNKKIDYIATFKSMKDRINSKGWNRFNPMLKFTHYELEELK